MIGTLLPSLLLRIWPYILMAGAVLAILLGIYNKGSSVGRAAIEAKVKDATLRANSRTISEMRAADRIRSDVRAAPSERLRERDPFSRD